LRLARAEGAVVSRDDLIQRCWEGRISSAEAAINRCICKLRDLSEAGGEQTFHIETISGVGYRIAAANEAAPTARAGIATRQTGRASGREISFCRRLWASPFSFASALVAYELWMCTPVRSRAASLRPAAKQPSIAVLPFKKFELRQRCGLFRGGRAGRNPDATREDRLAQGDLANVGRSIHEPVREYSGNRQTPWRGRMSSKAACQRSGNAVRINVS